MNLLDLDLWKKNLLNKINEFRERLEILERKVSSTGTGSGSKAVAEGPDIDLVYSEGTAVIGRGGDTILKFDSAGAPVAEYAATAAGLTSALAAATSGDVIEIPAKTITTAAQYVVPAGVTVRGMGRERTIIDAGYTAISPDSQETFIVFDLGNNSVLEKMTLDAYATRTVGVSEDTYLTGIDIDKGIVRNATIKIEVEYAWGKAWGIYGTNLYGGNVYDPTATIENVSIYTKLTKALDDTDQLIDMWAMEVDFDPDTSDEKKLCMIRNVDMVCTADMDDSVDQFLRWYGIDSDIYHGEIVIDSCNIKLSVDNPQAGYFELFGYYPGDTGTATTLIENSTVVAKITNSNGDNELYGITGGTRTKIKNCIADIQSDGAEYWIAGILAGLVVDGCDTYAHSSVPSSDVYGIEISGGATLLHSRFSGDTLDIYSDACSVYACQFDSSSGTITYLPGDRMSLGIPATQTTTYAVTQDNEIVLGNATGGGFSVTLPAAAGCKGWKETIKKIDASANAVTVDADGGETIDDDTTVIIDTQYGAIQIVCDGTEWWIV